LSPLLHQEDRGEAVQGEPRAVIERPTAHPRYAVRTLEVALLADGLPQRGGQVGRVDDRRVGPGRNLRPIRVERPRSVAALATDGVAFEDRCLVAVQCPGYGAEPVGVAGQALRVDRALEVRLRGEFAIAGRDIPTALLGEPGDGRLEEEAVA